MLLPPVDPEAAVYCLGVEVTLPPGRLHIEPYPAAEWIVAAASGRALAYIPPLLDGDERQQLARWLLRGRVSYIDVRQAGWDALEAASGWRWWIAERLIAGAVGAWPVLGGELLLSGIRPDEVPLGAFVAAVYARAIRDIQPEDRAKLDQALIMPPEGIPNRRELVNEMSQYAFADMLALGAAAAPFRE